MAQKTFVDGDVLTASDINTYLSHEGGAWTSFTPQIDQGVSDIAKTVDYSKYARSGRTITWTFTLTLTASGTAANYVGLTLPVTAASAVCGPGHIIDADGGYDAGVWVGASTTQIQLLTDFVGGAWGAAPNLALASGDVIRGSITYEAAS